MENSKEKMKEANSEINEKETYFTKYVKKNEITFFNPGNLIDGENNKDFICPICHYILNNPISCSDKENSHSFCKKCIDNYLEKNYNCPTCKLNFKYKINTEIINKLNKLSFNCLFKNEGCNNIIFYSEYLNHINNCTYNKNNKYECQIKKYNYEFKEFEICGYKGTKEDMEKHFDLYACNKYKCIFCNEDILQMDLEEHVKNKCKFGIINYPNGNTYIGEKNNNNLKEGIGKIYYINLKYERYEGEFKNDKREGYGIHYFYFNAEKYEGDFQNNKREGFGILYNPNGTRYEGEFKDGRKEGYGTEYNSNGIIYKGEWKNNRINGQVLFYYPDGGRYEGGFKNYKREGFGIDYGADGLNYIGGFRNDLFDGFGIGYYSNKIYFKGMCKNNIVEGYGIVYYLDGDRYEGEFKNGKREGYGIEYGPTGYKYEGEWKNDNMDGFGIEYYSDGRRFEGEFKDNKRKDGYAKEYLPNGDYLEGEIKNDDFNGFGIYYYSNGDKLEGEFENGIIKG